MIRITEPGAVETIQGVLASLGAIPPQSGHGLIVMTPEQFSAAVAAAAKAGEDKVLLGPVPELAGTIPCVFYFPTKADRDEFMAAVHEAKPNLRSRKL